MSPPLKAPIVGGAAQERFELPPAPKPVEPPPIEVPIEADLFPLPEEDGTPSMLENAEPVPPAPALAAAASIADHSKPVLALPPFPGHGAPSPSQAPVDPEDAFFTDRTPPLFQPTSDPALAVIKPPVSRTLLYAAAAVVGVGVGVYLMSLVTGQPTQTDDGGDEWAAIDAGTEALALVEFDAGADDEPVVALPEPADAGPAAVVVAAPVDAGAVVVAAPRDAGAAVALAPVKDAGTTVALNPAAGDAGVAVAAAAVDSEFEKLINQGKLAIEKERWTWALGAYRKAVKLKPEDQAARIGLGIAQVMNDSNYKEAVPLLQEGVKTDRTNAHAWLALGVAYSNLGRDKESKEPYSEYLKLKPTGPTADEVRSVLKSIK
jgi:hypothetical protein